MKSANRMGRVDLTFRLEGERLGFGQRQRTVALLVERVIVCRRRAQQLKYVGWSLEKSVEMTHALGHSSQILLLLTLLQDSLLFVVVDRVRVLCGESETHCVNG